MKYSLLLAAVLTIFACGDNKYQEKGFSVNPESETAEDHTATGLSRDSLQFDTRPGSVLLTGFPEHRLTTVYKVNTNKKDKTTFIGSNYFHERYSEEDDPANRWNYNFIPGLEAVYGYNIVNVSHFNVTTKTSNQIFESPVLVKTLYYPTYSKDTLNSVPVTRNYYLISTYDEDTNKDGFIGLKDLRRFYYFDIDTQNKTALVPLNYSVASCEYDPGNDFMFVYAHLDETANGKIDDGEETHIFWIDLKNPLNKGRSY